MFKKINNMPPRIIFYFYSRFAFLIICIICSVIALITTGLYLEVAFVSLSLIGIYAYQLFRNLKDVFNGVIKAYHGVCIRKKENYIVIKMDEDILIQFVYPNNIRDVKIKDEVLVYFDPSKSDVQGNKYIVRDVFGAEIYKYNTEESEDDEAFEEDTSKGKRRFRN